MNKLFQLCAVAALVNGQSAFASLIVGEQQFNTGNVLPSPLIASNTDLLQTSFLSVSGENASATVRNGSTGTAYANIAPDLAVIWGQTTTTYNLDLSVNTFGYDISEIRLFSGWSDARAGQSYQMFYSLVGNAAFTSLGTVSAPQSNGSLLTRTYDSDNTPILSGVDAIQFTQINNGSAGTGTVFREIDLLGVATVPETGSLALLVLGITFLRLIKPRR